MGVWTIQEAFEVGGLLHRVLEQYEPRQPQIELAVAIAEKMRAGGHLMAEGMTGVGKTLSYSIPAIRQSQLDSESSDHEEKVEDREYEGGEGEDFEEDSEEPSRVVIATANIALQEQLYFKDLPTLRRALPNNFNFALVKGRNNYLCKSQLDKFRLETASEAVPMGKDVSTVQLKDLYDVINSDEEAICKWSQETEFGDKSELEIEPRSETWRKFSVTAEECIGSECPYRKEVGCHAESARKALQFMDVIIVNYHMLFSAVKVQMETGKDIVLPPFKYLICDEGHKMPDIARAFFGWHISQAVMNQAVNMLRKVVSKAGTSDEEGEIVAARINAAHGGIKKFWDEVAEVFGDHKGQMRITRTDVVRGLALAQSLVDVADSLLDFSEFSVDGFSREEIRKKAGQLKRVVDHLRDAMELGDQNSVYFIERAGKNRWLNIVNRKLDVGDILWQNLFERTKSTVVTSATLAVDGDCSFLRKELGLAKCGEVLVGSPFNFREQACILLSDRAPDPKQDNYPVRVSVAMAEIIKQAGGRTLGLFTSYRVLHYVAEYIQEEMPDLNCLVQGTAPRRKLIEEFTADVGSVLLGTESFWTGIDVPGESLSCLVIDKIPFPSPANPVLAALSERAVEGGFWGISIPRAVLQFRQGVGRLIRRESDRGIIVVLDNRLVTKGYGSIFLNSLPRMKLAKSLRDNQITRWLEGEV